MLSNPVFSKRDAIIIAVLFLSGAAMMIEAHHHILIVAPAETAGATLVSSVATRDGTSVSPAGQRILAPVGAATFEPTFAARVTAALE